MVNKDYVIARNDFFPNSAEWFPRVLNSVSMNGVFFIMDKMGKDKSCKSSQNQNLDKFCMYSVDERKLKNLKQCPRNLFSGSLLAYRNFLYVNGGQYQRISQNSCYAYNIYRDFWYSITDMNESRSHHRSVIVDGKIFSFGGISNQGNTLSTGEYLDINKNTVKTIAKLNMERSAMGAVVLDNVIYAIGGESQRRNLYTMEMYDHREGSWKILPRICICIICSEGIANYIEKFDHRSNKWETIRFSGNENREFYEIFSYENELFSTNGEEISKFNFSELNWETVIKYPESRDWDTVVVI